MQYLGLIRELSGRLNEGHTQPLAQFWHIVSPQDMLPGMNNGLPRWLKRKEPAC